jgi:hypothetical protein
MCPSVPTRISAVNAPVGTPQAPSEESDGGGVLDHQAAAVVPLLTPSW